MPTKGCVFFCLCVYLGVYLLLHLLFNIIYFFCFCAKSNLNPKLNPNFLPLFWNIPYNFAYGLIGASPLHIFIITVSFINTVLDYRYQFRELPLPEKRHPSLFCKHRSAIFENKVFNAASFAPPLSASHFAMLGPCLSSCTLRPRIDIAGELLLLPLPSPPPRCLSVLRAASPSPLDAGATPAV